MIVDKKSFCFQGQIRTISSPMDNRTKVEIRIDLGTKADSSAGELSFRVPLAEKRLYIVGERYTVSASPVE